MYDDFTGPQGGFRGMQGCQGSFGSQGAQGCQGSFGSQGAQGTQGFPGPRGYAPVVSASTASDQWCDTCEKLMPLGHSCVTMVKPEKPYMTSFPDRQPWVCPRCNKMNGPHVDQCSCKPTTVSDIAAVLDIPGPYGSVSTEGRPDNLIVQPAEYQLSTFGYTPVGNDRPDRA